MGPNFQHPKNGRGNGPRNVPRNAPGDDPEDDGVRRSGRKIKPATFADGTAVNQFIKSEF